MYLVTVLVDGTEPIGRIVFCDKSLDVAKRMCGDYSVLWSGIECQVYDRDIGEAIWSCLYTEDGVMEWDTREELPLYVTGAMLNKEARMADSI